MLDAIAQLFWPQVCPVCEQEVAGGDRVHARCLARLARARHPSAAVVVACFEDGPLCFRLLHQWKYGGERGLAAVVAACMCEDDHRIPADGILVPVPDDDGRLLQRGYSPVGDLARQLARRTGRTCDPGLLRRARSTISQTSCDADCDRRANVRGAFRVGDLARWSRFRTLVIVEDQVTSGATVREAAALLAARGAPVVVWCVARAARAPHRLDDPVGRH